MNPNNTMIRNRYSRTYQAFELLKIEREFMIQMLRLRLLRKELSLASSIYNSNILTSFDLGQHVHCGIDFNSSDKLQSEESER